MEEYNKNHNAEKAKLYVQNNRPIPSELREKISDDIMDHMDYFFENAGGYTPALPEDLTKELGTLPDLPLARFLTSCKLMQKYAVEPVSDSTVDCIAKIQLQIARAFAETIYAEIQPHFSADGVDENTDPATLVANIRDAAGKICSSYEHQKGEDGNAIADQHERIIENCRFLLLH